MREERYAIMTIDISEGIDVITGSKDRFDGSGSSSWPKIQGRV
jgi:hypothetical protein